MILHEKRFMAAIIDMCIHAILSFLVFLLTPTLFSGYLKFMIIYCFVSFIITTLFMSLLKGKSIGMYFIGLKALSINWDNISYKSVIIRALCYGIPVLYIINILYMGIYRTTSSIFDDLSNSIVVNIADTYKFD